MSRNYFYRLCYGDVFSTAYDSGKFLLVSSCMKAARRRLVEDLNGATHVIVYESAKERRCLFAYKRNHLDGYISLVETV